MTDLSPLVLSLFPGIGLLDMAFEEEGFCVVRGPDLLWGGDIKKFHPPAGKFDGVIGGPPCQAFSKLGVMARERGMRVGTNLIPEFERCTVEAAPAWFLMENVPGAPIPAVPGYDMSGGIIDNRLDGGGDQRRRRRFAFGSRNGRVIEFDWWRPMTPAALIPTVTANGSFWDSVKQQSRGDKTTKTMRLTARAQGLPEDFLEESPFTVAGKIWALGNGVPLPMGRAVAKAVRKAVG